MQIPSNAPISRPITPKSTEQHPEAAISSHNDVLITFEKRLPLCARYFPLCSKVKWCEAPHFQYQVAGRLHVVMSDGTEFDAGPGMVTRLPSGHDAWVLGDEAVVLIDCVAIEKYNSPSSITGSPANVDK